MDRIYFKNLHVFKTLTFGIRFFKIPYLESVKYVFIF